MITALTSLPSFVVGTSTLPKTFVPSYNVSVVPGVALEIDTCVFVPAFPIKLVVIVGFAGLTVKATSNSV